MGAYLRVGTCLSEIIQDAGAYTKGAYLKEGAYSNHYSIIVIFSFK